MDEDQRKETARRRQRAKNWALAALLLGFCVLVYFVSIVRMGGE
ncbi:MAG: hypothetical protein ACREDZ_14575 [Kiloniellales bacterium]